MVNPLVGVVAIVLVMALMGYYFFPAAIVQQWYTTDLIIPDTEGTTYVNRVTINATNNLGEHYNLYPKLICKNIGYENRTGGNWTAYLYGFVRLNQLNETNPDYVGNFGDWEMLVTFWDATIVEERGYVELLFARNGWSEYKIYVDNELYTTIPLLTSGFVQPTIGYFDGALYANGTHTP